MNVSTQRAAIEELVPALQPFVLQPGARYFLERQEVFFCGLSSGSGGGDASVAVFSAGPPAGPAYPVMRPMICAGAVLLHSVEADDELAEAVLIAGSPETAIEAVEVLVSRSIETRQVALECAGQKAFYPVLVTGYRPSRAAAA
jgi:hypothetical protein